MHESKMHEQNCFITLTYDDDHLPVDRSLDVEHWQYFAKRVRKRLARDARKRGKDEKPKPFRFFHCGEYGDQTARPHYHAAIFGQDFSGDRKLYKKTKQGDSLYTSSTLDKLWGKGTHNLIGNLTFDSAAYVAGYITKKVTGNRQYDHYEYVDDEGNTFLVKPEYTTMSRRPGIGSTWIEKFITDVYPSDQVISNGKPARPPKFYDQVLERVDPDLHKTIKARRVEAAEQHEENNTPERLEVRETVTKARNQLKRRTL